MIINIIREFLYVDLNKKLHEYRLYVWDFMRDACSDSFSEMRGFRVSEADTRIYP